jgi:hypothetical protein
VLIPVKVGQSGEQDRGPDVQRELCRETELL